MIMMMMIMMTRGPGQLLPPHLRRVHHRQVRQGGRGDQQPVQPQRDPGGEEQRGLETLHQL